jgi:hypothetical protein
MVAVGEILGADVSGIGVGRGVCVGAGSIIGVEFALWQAVIRVRNPIIKMKFFIAAPIKEI